MDGLRSPHLPGRRMNDLSCRWYSPAPSEIPVSRISLDFDLRSADLFFRELVVPELGRIWFVRQISWPLAALALHYASRPGVSRLPKPTAICHAIEALACKLEYTADREDRSERILGTRAFGRDADSEIWTFDRLRQSTNYVRSTHRQAATRVLRTDGGLGFATGLRFDLLELEPVGKQLGEAFLRQAVGKGGTSLRKWLLGWIEGDRDISTSRNTLLAALSPEQPTAEEQNAVRRRLLETMGPATDKRVRLALALGRASEAPEAEDIEATVIPRLRQAGHRKQADEIVAALAFGAVLDRARDATSVLTYAVELARSGLPIAVLRARREGPKLARRAQDGLPELPDKGGHSGGERIDQPRFREVPPERGRQAGHFGPGPESQTGVGFIGRQSGPRAPLPYR